MQQLRSTFLTWHLANTWVIVRADLNIPSLKGGRSDDSRLIAFQPTLNALYERHARVILITHIGDPRIKDEKLSTKQLVPWFDSQGYNTMFAPDIATVRTLKKSDAQLIILENIRFFPQEKEHSSSFAQELASLGEYLVNDAFGALHRTDTSISLLPAQFDYDHRSIGLLVERELSILTPLRNHPIAPYLVILGGAKLTTKIPLVQELLSRANTIILNPALCFTFAKAAGNPVGKSLVDNSLIETCTAILETAQELNIPLALPLDYLVAEHHVDGKQSVVDAHGIQEHQVGISIGPETEKMIEEYIARAQTIFFNGISGFNDRSETLHSMNTLFQAIGKSSATSVIAGGDSLAALAICGQEKAFTHQSTGGGAALSYIAGKELPGLEAMIKS